MQVIRTYSFRIKDSTSKKRLKDAAGSVNFVWNDLNHTSHERFVNRASGGLHMTSMHCSQTFPRSSQNSTARLFRHSPKNMSKHTNCTKKSKLRWCPAKKSTLKWIPFKSSAVKWTEDSIRYRGKKYRFDSDMLSMFKEYGTIRDFRAERASLGVFGVSRGARQRCECSPKHLDFWLGWTT